MPDHTLDARITETGTIDCVLKTSGHALIDPVICFSLMAPGDVISGGRLIEGCGSFYAVQLDGTLSPDTPLAFSVGHGTFRAANRAWLPLGVYLRLSDGTTQPVTGGPAGAWLGEPTPTTQPDLALVPPPSSWTPNGNTAPFPGIASLPDGLEAIDQLGVRTGLGPLTTPDGWTCETEIDTSLGKEGYRLKLAPGMITLAAGGIGGVRYGLISLLTLRATHGGDLPLGVIEDNPRFEWRGQHLDCARHFYRVETIERLLDLMALMKLNVFHWHFADDEAFRLEIECAPALWEDSAFRGEGQVIPGVFGGGAGPTGGTYSKLDAVHIISRARELGIDVLPEIEFPAHALVTARIFPNLRDPEDTGTETSVQGYTKNVVSPAIPETEAFFDAIAQEVAALFPFAHLHLGGDELPENTWDGSPLVDALKAREGLTTKEDVQGWAMERLATKLAAAGITPCAWEESMLGCQGGIGHDTILFSWKGQEAGLAAARRGHPVVMCPAQNVYMDMAHTSDTDDWGANWAAYVSLADTIAWDPVPEDEPELETLIKGVEGAFWSEFTTQDDEIEPMLAPRILGVASKAWSTRSISSSLDLAGFAGAYQTIFGAMNWAMKHDA
ncbi:MAG: family 20 glycosylhydrolase [Rhodobacteraceae bacterium]|nr:family 20 glycosylhydrolase [Paracoccaceae bacterium]